jgi:hypothetical protein
VAANNAAVPSRAMVIFNPPRCTSILPLKEHSGAAVARDDNE